MEGDWENQKTDFSNDFKLRTTKNYRGFGENNSSTIKIEYAGNNRVIIHIPFDQELIRKIKSIFGKNGMQRENTGKSLTKMI